MWEGSQCRILKRTYSCYDYLAKNLSSRNEINLCNGGNMLQFEDQRELVTVERILQVVFIDPQKASSVSSS